MKPRTKAFYENLKRIIGNLGSGIERAGQGMLEADKKMDEMMKNLIK